MEDSWKRVLHSEFQQRYFSELKSFLIEEKKQGYTVYPPGGLIFNAFRFCPFDQVKVLILGQDPYHGHGQAHGLCFSVSFGIPPPPSLVNIFKELKTDLGLPIPPHGNLEKWARQGVLLLNSSLTVRAHEASSHFGHGWELFTDAVVQKLSDEKDNIVFLLWGSPAQKKGQRINTLKHCVLKAPHPSPLSASRGFFGCKHFSQANAYLRQHNKTPVDWALEDSSP
jgi:uracil-DNA glycosylase